MHLDYITQNMAKKKKRKLKPAGWLALFILIGLVLVLPSFLLYRCTRSWFQDAEPAPIVSPADSIYTLRMDSLIAHHPRIDTLQTSVYIYDLTEGCPVYGYRDSLQLIPASCMKIVTTAASWRYLGGNYRFADSLFMQGTVEQGVLQGNVYLKGDFDPLITSFDSLYIGLKNRGISQIEGDVIFSIPMRSAIEFNDSWTPGDIKQGRLPLMLKNEKVIRSNFVAGLKKAGIKHKGSHNLGAVPPGSEFIAAIGHPVKEIIVPMMLHSSNILAETLYGRLCEQGEGRDIMYRFINEELQMQEEDCYILDGSGLSPENRLSTPLLTHVLRYLYQDENCRELMMQALPLAGSDSQRGTLKNRMKKTTAADAIYAKTGTLNSVGASSLSGYCKGLFDHWYAFSIINNGISIEEGRLFQDAVCIALTTPIE